MARKFNLMFLLSLSLFLIFGTTSFASGDWNLEYEKYLYDKNIAVYKNSSKTGTINIKFDNATTKQQIFNMCESAMEDSKYEQFNYPYMIIRFYPSYIQMLFAHTIIPTNESYLWQFGDDTYGRVGYRINYNADYSIISLGDKTFVELQGSGNYYIGGDSPTTIFLSKYSNDSIIINNENVLPNMSQLSDYGLNFSTDVIGEFNSESLENNFILNKEFFIGNNYDFEYDYYYYSGDSKASIKNYISFEETNTWSSIIYSPYISYRNMTNIPNDKTFYFSLNVIGKSKSPGVYSTYNDVEVFKTDSSIISPPSTSGDNSGDSGESGDTGGGTTTPNYNEKLDNIQGSLNDIKENIPTSGDMHNIISGEVGKITETITKPADFDDKEISSGDIIGAIDFEPPDDPYENFWFSITTGLSNAFTNSKREISIQFRDKTHIISLDNFSVQIPSALKPFLTIISTVFITWKMLQYIKIIVDNISSGNIDEVLEMNEEEGITNLF